MAKLKLITNSESGLLILDKVLVEHKQNIDFGYGSGKGHSLKKI